MGNRPFDGSTAAFLMSRDEENLRLSSSDGLFRLEIYRFARPSVTAGRNARVSPDLLDIIRSHDHDFARRPTGGGILRHHGDLCFGAVFPGETSAAHAFSLVSAAIRDSLAGQGIVTTLPEVHADQPGFCFHAAVGEELLLEGKKILGLAGRRVKGAVLVQGSLAVSRNPELDSLILGVGPETSLEGTGFDEALFAKAFREKLISS